VQFANKRIHNVPAATNQRQNSLLHSYAMLTCCKNLWSKWVHREHWNKKARHMHHWISIQQRMN